MYKRVRTVSKYMGKVHGNQSDGTENRVVRTEELESKHIRASIMERNVFLKAASGEDTVERVGFLEASVAQREGDHLSGVDVRGRIDNTKLDERVIEAAKLWKS